MIYILVFGIVEGTVDCRLLGIASSLLVLSDFILFIFLILLVRLLWRVRTLDEVHGPVLGAVLIQLVFDLLPLLDA